MKKQKGVCFIFFFLLLTMSFQNLVFAQEPQAAGQSLYDRLGGERAVTAVVEDFVARAAANPKVNFTRQGTPKPWEATPEKLARLKSHLVQFISVAAGGEVVYEGKDMVTVHAGMEITNDEFDALAGDLKASLEHFNVPIGEQTELLEIVETTRGAIVEKE